MLFTRILRGPSSLASTPVMASSAPLVAEYTALLGGVRLVMAEPTLMMLAPSARCFDAACVVSSAPSTLTSNWRWKCGRLISSIEANSYTPELLTRTSRRPNWLTAASITACASAGLATSPCTATARPPALVISATTASAPALLDA